MLRKLLTLLAICAGFAAVAEPARAAAVAVESVRLVQREGTQCAQSAQQRLPLMSSGWSVGLQDRGRPCPKPTVIIVVPTVMLKIDRARE